MEDKIKKKRATLVFYLLSLFVLFLSAGIYYLIKTKNDSSSKYNLDKYSEIIDWCDIGGNDDNLTLKCEGLLSNIKSLGDDRVCFEVQLLTKDSEYKDVSVCEESGTISYTNDVLNYKKLMPIEVVFSYANEKGNDYVLNSASFLPADKAYIQDIVNNNIADLITTDPNTTTIQNSVDFCPKPETLPDYVTEANKTAYTEYFNKNILSEDEYVNIFNKEFETLFLNNWTDSKINILFGCESSGRLGYSTICDTTLGSKFKNPELSTLPTFVSDWSNISNSESDLISLKNLSLTLDGMLYRQPHANYSSSKIIAELFKFITENNNNQNVYCSGYKIFEKLAKYNSTAESQLQQIKTLVANNISSASSICLDILDKNLYSKEGLYLRASGTKDVSGLNVYTKCNNLYQLMINE